jgi:DNA invertase Pin-like site-specific DNA recombinase
VDKLDRWSRDPEFSYRSVREILATRATIYFVSEAVDPSTVEGDNAFGLHVMVARMEHKRIRERMVGTRDRLRDLGYYAQGNEPFGYRRGAPKGVKSETKNILIAEKTEAAIVRQIFSMCLRGISMGKIAAHFGLKLDRVKDVLDRRLYTGEMKNTKGEWIQGKHAAIIDVDTFTRARAALDARRLGGPRPRDAAARTDDWILRDVATCARCGARMSAAYAGSQITLTAAQKERLSKLTVTVRKSVGALRPVSKVRATRTLDAIDSATTMNAAKVQRWVDTLESLAGTGVAADAEALAHCIRTSFDKHAAQSTYTRVYYKCSHKCTTRDRKGARRANSQAHVPVRDVEAKALPMVLARLVELREHLASAPSMKEPITSPLDVAAKRKALETKRARYVEMYSDGVISKADMVTKIADVDTALLKLKRPPRDPLARAEVRRDVLKDVAAIEKAWTNAGPERRRKIVGHIAVAFKLEAGCEPKPIWRSLEELASPFVAVGS